MADVNSTGYTNDNATPPVNHEPQEGGGRVRIYYDTYLQGAADGNIGDVIQFKDLPGNAQLLEGKMFWGTGNTNETIALGISGTADKFLAATAAATAGNADALAHLASGLNYKTPAAGIRLLGTNGTAAIKAAQRITVWFKYVID